MQRAANEVMQSIVFSAVLDAVAALKSASGGLPNQLLRDVQAIHANVTFADLPKELAGRDRSEHPLGLHPASEGGLCGRPPPADAGDAADGPGSGARSSGRRRTAARFATARAGAARRAPEGDGPGQGTARSGRTRRRPSRPRKPPKGKPRLS